MLPNPLLARRKSEQPYQTAAKQYINRNHNNNVRYILVVPLEFGERVFRVATATLCHGHALEVCHQKTDGGFQLLDVRALHLLHDEGRARTVFLQSSNTHIHSVLTAIFPGEPGSAGCPLILLFLHPFGTDLNFPCHS